jgi:lysophospholipase L1-like esterase
VLHFFDRIVTPYQPETIVFFAGTNDLAAGRSPGEVVRNTEEFIKRVNEIDPTTKILILSNTIAVVRKNLHEFYMETNRQLAEMLKKYENAEYVDVTTPGLQENGQPRPEIYTADSLHLNQQGYELWKNILMPYLTGE